MGAGKTGTSSIQQFLNRNRTGLAEIGYLYPRTPGPGRHVRLGLSIQPDNRLNGRINWHRQRASSPQAFRKSFRRRLIGEINKSGLSRVVFSDEALFGASTEALRRLCELVDGIAGSLRLVVYLRRQDDHLVSRYQQVVKTGETRRLKEWASHLDWSKDYDYHARLRGWERLLEPDEVVVRRFERDGFANGSLLQDFLDSAGIDARAEELRQVPVRNISLDAETVEFLRLLNIYRVENEGARVGLIDNRGLVERLAEHSTGPILTLPVLYLDRFMAAQEQGNRAVARRYLRDATGELFRLPRKTENTTTEQDLDPSRLGRLLSVLDLPEHLRSPLRRLAEREASIR